MSPSGRHYAPAVKKSAMGTVLTPPVRVQCRHLGKGLGRGRDGIPIILPFALPLTLVLSVRVSSGTLPSRRGVGEPLFSLRRPSMGKKLYVGNLAYTISDSDLQQVFAPHGTVQSAQVIMDRDTGRSKGFGFVEMGSDAEAQAAIQALNGSEIEGRTLTVNEARPKTEGPRGGGGGGRGGRGGYGGGGGGRGRY